MMTYLQTLSYSHSVRLTTLLLSIILVFTSVTVYPQSQSIVTKYQAQKNDVQSSITSINESIKQRNVALYDVTQRKSSLQAEIQSRQDGINQIDTNITEAKLAAAQLQVQIDENTKKRDELYDQMAVIVPRLQQESKKTGVQTVLESKNVGELLRHVFGLSTFQVELENLDKQLEELNTQLAESKKQQEEVQAALQNSIYQLRTGQGGLQILLEETKGEESQYQQLVADLNSQRQQQQAQSAQLDAAYQAEIARSTAQQSGANNNNSSGSPRSTSGSNNSGGSGSYVPPTTPGVCRFQDGSDLGVRLTRPAEGIRTQTFGCPSDVGINHDGIDIANKEGTAIKAAYRGVVQRKGSESGGFGNFIFIRHSTPSGRTFYTLYAHMNVPSPLSEGTQVEAGSQVGTMGRTGLYRGEPGFHLHFMVYSDSYKGDLGCDWGKSTKCFDPGLYTDGL